MEEKVEITDEEIAQVVWDSNESNASLSSTSHIEWDHITLSESSRNDQIQWPISNHYLQISPIINRTLSLS